MLPEDVQNRFGNATLARFIAPSGGETRAPEPLEKFQRRKDGDDDDNNERQVVGMQRPEAEQRTGERRDQHESQQRHGD